MWEGGGFFFILVKYAMAKRREFWKVRKKGEGVHGGFRNIFGWLVGGFRGMI